MSQTYLASKPTNFTLNNTEVSEVCSDQDKDQDKDTLYRVGDRSRLITIINQPLICEDFKRWDGSWPKMGGR